MKKSYRVEFIVKKGGQKTYAIDVEASSAKNAKVIAMAKWYESNTAHAFDVQARRLADTEEFLYHYFKEIG